MAAILAILENMNITKGTSDGKFVSEFKSFLDQWARVILGTYDSVRREPRVHRMNESNIADWTDFGVPVLISTMVIDRSA
jgi:hypothetical protein